MKLKSLFTTTLAAGIAATSFAFPTRTPAPAAKSAMTANHSKHARMAKAKTVKVKGYTYKTKSGKMVTVKAHERKAAGVKEPGKVKVKAYTYKTKSGKTVHVKAHERKAPAKKMTPKM